jgi:formylglycine-generating enzyme required for sulfatase activity
MRLIVKFLLLLLITTRKWRELMKIVNRLLFLFSIIVLLTALPVRANNITVGTPTLTGVNTTTHVANVQFNLSWENSWKDDINWDAAWVFVKYRVGSGEWNHAYLSGTASDQVIPAGYGCSMGKTNSNTLGVFIYRSTAGSGNNSLANVKLLWNYGANGVADFSTVTIKVFAVEMVYVPQGAFYVGDANADQVNCFYKYGTTGPFQITGEGTIFIGKTNGSLWAKDGGFIETSTLPAAFPKGYAAFYSMKYEISQGQWVDFFNTLNNTQKTTRDITSSSTGKNSDAIVNRNTVSWTAGDAICTRPDRACNYLCWADEAAYADWACLRPMTELEFEKACRGTQNVVNDEYAWGTTTATGAAVISGTENGTETVTNSGANCNYLSTAFSGGDGGGGPLRCGIFAKPSATREQSGATFYGIMELSGNQFEYFVSIGQILGRKFTGSHGDGSLDGNGNANVANWPGIEATGSGMRGGSFYALQKYLLVSDRSFAGAPVPNRMFYFGFRCVRSAP